MVNNTKVAINPITRLGTVYFDATPITAEQVTELAVYIDAMKEATGAGSYLYLYTNDDGGGCSIGIHSVTIPASGVEVQFAPNGSDITTYFVYGVEWAGHQAGHWFKSDEPGTELTGEIEINLNSQGAGKTAEGDQSITLACNAVFAKYFYDKDTASHSVINPVDTIDTAYLSGKSLTNAQIEKIADYIDENGTPLGRMSGIGTGNGIILYSGTATPQEGSYLGIESMTMGPGLVAAELQLHAEEIAALENAILVASNLVNPQVISATGTTITPKHTMANNTVAMTVFDNSGWNACLAYKDSDGVVHGLFDAEEIRFTDATINESGLAQFEEWGGTRLETVFKGLNVTALDPAMGEAGISMNSIFNMTFQGLPGNVWISTLGGVPITGEVPLSIGSEDPGIEQVTDEETGESWTLSTEYNNIFQGILYTKSDDDAHLINVYTDHCVVLPIEGQQATDEINHFVVYPEEGYDTITATINSGTAEVDGEAVNVSGVTDNCMLEVVCSAAPTSHSFTASGTHCTVNPTSGTIDPGSAAAVHVTAASGYVFDSNAVITITPTGAATYILNFGNNTVVLSNATSDFSVNVECAAAPAPTTHNFEVVTAHGTSDPASGQFVEGQQTTITVTPDQGYLFNEDTAISYQCQGRVEYTRTTTGIIVTSATNAFRFIITCQPETPTSYTFTATCTNGTVSPASGSIAPSGTQDITVTSAEGYKFNGNVTVTNADKTVSGTTITISNPTGNVTVAATCDELPVDPSLFKLIYEKNGRLYGSTTGFVSSGDVEFALYNSTETELILGEGPQTSGECQLKTDYKILYDAGQDTEEKRILKASKTAPTSSDTTIVYKKVTQQ